MTEVKKEIRVSAPATIANVACGFDIFALALEAPVDEVLVRFSQKPGVRITKITGDEGALSLDAEKNTAGISVLEFLKFLKENPQYLSVCTPRASFMHFGIEIEVYKKVPLESGLGSSAVSAAASVFAVNAALGFPLSSKELIVFAMEAERIACGSAIADNVAASLLGGFVLIRSYEPLDVIQIPVNLDLYCSVLHPKMKINTRMARDILKKEVSLQQHVRQSGNAAGLIAGLMSGEQALIGRCLKDVLIEPVRSQLIPGFYEIQAAAVEEGALGCTISGAGPSIFAMTTSKEHAERVGLSMMHACHKNGLDCSVYISPISKKGPKII